MSGKTERAFAELEQIRIEAKVRRELQEAARRLEEEKKRLQAQQSKQSKE
jgi:hypothetical protein